METYSFLREFADSWMLLVLFCFFVGVFFWVIRPGSNAAHDEAKTVILRNEDRPARSRPDEPTKAPRWGDPAATKEARS